MALVDEVIGILAATLQLGDRAAQLDDSSPLLGAVPEFDSMAVVTVITSLEESYGIDVEDDEIDAATFETVGSLTRFVQQKLDE